MIDTYSAVTRDGQCIAVQFRMCAEADEVAGRLLRAVQWTDLSLVQLLCDGDRVYPFGGTNAAAMESSWRAEFLWTSSAPDAVWRLEVFLGLAKFLLGLPGGLQIEIGGVTDRENRADELSSM
jgi:hypothetical protein